MISRKRGLAVIIALLASAFPVGSALAVDRVGAAVRRIRDDANALGLSGRVRTVRADVLAALGRLGREGLRFDLVLVDPPYASGLAPLVLAELVRAAVLAPGAQVVVESDRRHPLPEVVGLDLEDERRYGDTIVTFHRAGDTSPPSSSPRPGEE